MKKSDRHGLFSRDRKKAYRQRLEAIAKLKVLDGMTEQEARAHLRERAKHVRDKGLPYEPCKARNRRGEPCKVLALDNGRCKYHGGLSTGQKTPEGKAKALANLRNRK